MTNLKENPLLEPGLPRFDTIGPEHALPAIEHLLENYQRVLDEIGNGASGDFNDVAGRETLADDDLARAWSTVGHLSGVMDSPEMREAHGKCLEAVTRFYTRRGQNRDLLEAYRRVAKSRSFDQLSPAARRLVENEIRDFRLSGVELKGKARKRFAEISLRLSELGKDFSNQLLDATEAYTEQFDDASALAGLPEAELSLLASTARHKDQSGFAADLSQPCYLAIMTYADDRELRKRFYRAHATRASGEGPNAGDHDNGPLIRETLSLRREQAELLGYTDFATMRLEDRMARSPGEVDGFLRDLATRAGDVAGDEFESLTRFARDFYGPQAPPENLEPWDIAYYSEKMREEKLGLSQERLRPWFELERVVEGLFGVAQSLFGIRLELDPAVTVWHPDVRYYRLINSSGKPAGGLYLDLYARSGKQGGAWMDVCRSRLKLAGRDQDPVAYLTCNFAPASPGHPSLLTHSEVETLFHEFGHCLHHLLTRVTLPPVGGIMGVEWDAVELPSQLLEGWVWEREALVRFARHHETNETLPEEWMKALRADQTFLGAMALVRQIEFALTDLALHVEPDPEPEAVMQRIHAQVGVTPLPDWNRSLNGFSHLFAGSGYAAGYYSYLWAERLARDAFGVFRAKGLFDPGAGHKLEAEILSVGASRPMRESWQAFRGRDAALEPLLEAYGIAA